MLQVQARCPKLRAVKFATGVRLDGITRLYVAVSEEVAGNTREFRKAAKRILIL